MDRLFNFVPSGSRLLPVIVLALFCLPAKGQQMLGLAHSSYGGLHTMATNPASLNTSRLKMQVNLFSLNIGAETNLYSTSLNGSGLSLLSYSEEGLNSLDRLGQIEENRNANFNLYIQARGPGLMLNLGKYSFGLSSRVISMTQIVHMDRSLARYFLGDSLIRDSLENQGAVLRDDRFSLGTYNYAEVGLAFAMPLLETDDRRLSIGGQMKYLTGGPVLALSSRALSIETYPDSAISTRATLDYRAQFPNQEEEGNNLLKSLALGRGVGMDLGVMYELRDPEVRAGKWGGRHLARFGAAITDLGIIHYRAPGDSLRYMVNFEAGARRLDGLDSADFSDGNETRELISTNFDQARKADRFNIYTPAVLNLTADYQLYRGIYLGAQYTQNLLPIATHGGRIFSSLTLCPRLETKVVELAFPLGFGLGISRFRAGAYFRISGFFIGSDNLLALATTEGSSGLDAYFGFTVPIARKARKGKKPTTTQ